MLTKALPSAGVAKKAKPSGKGRNLALLGVAGGLAAAIKNRDKLSFGRGKTEPVAPPAAYEPPPASGPAVVTPDARPEV